MGEGLRKNGFMRKIPKCIERYFWDVNMKDIDVKKNKFFIIKRILENGDEKAVRWMFDRYNIEDVKYALLNFKGYDKRTLNFWGSILGLKVDKYYDWR